MAGDDRNEGAIPSPPPPSSGRPLNPLNPVEWGASGSGIRFQYQLCTKTLIPLGLTCFYTRKPTAVEGVARDPGKVEKSS